MKNNLDIIRRKYELVVRYLTSKHFLVRGKYIHELGEAIRGLEAELKKNCETCRKYAEKYGKPVQCEYVQDENSKVALPWAFERCFNITVMDVLGKKV